MTESDPVKRLLAEATAAASTLTDDDREYLLQWAQSAEVIMERAIPFGADPKTVPGVVYFSIGAVHRMLTALKGLKIVP